MQIVVILWLLTEGKELYEKGMESSKYVINVSVVGGNVWRSSGIEFNQRGAQWRGLGDTQRQTREFISGLSLGTRAKFLTFNRT